MCYFNTEFRRLLLRWLASRVKYEYLSADVYSKSMSKESKGLMLVLQTNTIPIIHELMQEKLWQDILMTALLVLPHSSHLHHAHYLLAARKVITIHRIYSLFSEVVYYGWGYTSLHLVSRRLASWRLQAWHLFALRYGILTPNITSTFAPPAMERYRDGFFEYICPLCQQDVDILQPDSYRALPLNLERIAIFSERPTPDSPERYQSSLNTCSLNFRDWTVEVK